MGSNLFFTGLSGAGKSTLIQQALQMVCIWPAGFRTIRVYDDHDKVCAYVVSDVRSPELAVRFMTRDEGEEWRRDDLLFCRVALDALEQAEAFDVILMDEIGGKELLNVPFRQRIIEILESPIPCIGVLKDRSGMERQIRKQDPDNDTYREAYEQLRTFLEKSSDSTFLTVTKHNREAMFTTAVSFLKKISI